ncbi:MAG: galactonate dehydratase [Microlunatus sp.]|nr:galactonate dehydratase [Microlunatus sp.]
MTAARPITAIDTFKIPPRWMLVRVTTTDGVGWGEAIIPKRTAAVAGAISDLARNLTGRDANRIEDLWQRMYRGGFFRGGPVLSTAAAAIEQALWDLKTRAAGLPVYDFLGGPVRERIRSYAWIGGDKPAAVVAGARERIAQGFTAVKLNATEAVEPLERGRLIDDVLGRVGALRDAFGDGLDIALDFHGRVPRAAARILIKELETYRLLWVEEPGTPGSEDTLRELVRTGTSVPIATGERLCSRWDFLPLLAEGVVDILQPDVSITGIFELEKIARMAEPYDVVIAPHCPNGPVSLAASLQLGFCCPNIVIQEQSAGIHYHQGYAGLPAADLHDYLLDPAPLRCEEGYFTIGHGSGLGIELDQDKIIASVADWQLPDPDWHYDDGRYAEW